MRLCCAGLPILTFIRSLVLNPFVDPVMLKGFLVHVILEVRASPYLSRRAAGFPGSLGPRPKLLERG